MYSGEASDEFWSRIAAIRPQELRKAVSIAGYALQDHETRMLNMVAHAEEKSDDV